MKGFFFKKKHPPSDPEELIATMNKHISGLLTDSCWTVSRRSIVSFVQGAINSVGHHSLSFVVEGVSGAVAMGISSGEMNLRRCGRQRLWGHEQCPL